MNRARALKRLGVILPLFAALTMGLPESGYAEAAALTKAKADTYVKRVLVGEYGSESVSALRRRCVRRTAWKRVCSVDVKLWTYTRYRGTMTITRRGTELSPIDTFKARLRGVATDADDILLAGRFTVATRRATVGQTLRLWDEDETDFDVTMGPAIEVAGTEDDAPRDGLRWVRFDVTMTHTGTGDGRAEPPLSLARLVLGDGTAVDTSFRVPGCSSALDLAPGDTRRACVAFEIPMSSTWNQIEWSAGAETGVWTP